MNLATDTSIGFILGNSGEGGYNNILKKNKAVANGIGIQIFTATDNLLEENFSIGNDIYDMVDDNDTCDNNTWLNNFFGTALVYDGDGDQTCIR
jgi:parallel beta-helix repeat protein